MDDHVLVVLPAGHALAGQAAVDPAAIGDHERINTDFALGDFGVGDPVGPPWALEFAGHDFRTALNLVAAGLGVALLPSLALHQAPPGAVARPTAGLPLVRRLRTARLDTTRVPTPVRRLEAHLHDVAAALAR